MKLAVNSRVEFDDITHSYLLDNRTYLTGVTTLLKKHGLSPDYSGVSEEVLKQAAERGSKIHKDIENYCNGKEVVMTPGLKAYTQLGIKSIANEYLVSDNKMIASSIDIVADAGNGMVDLIDIKTTSVLHIEAIRWQLSIYAHLFKVANNGLSVNNLYALHIRDGKAKLVKVSEVALDEIHALLLAEEKGEIYTPVIPELSITTQQMLLNLENVTYKLTLVKDSLKALEEIKKGIEDKIITEMERSTRRCLENGQVKVTYIAASERETVDKAKLQKELPELYEKYRKVTQVSPSLRITIKNK